MIDRTRRQVVRCGVLAMLLAVTSFTAGAQRRVTSPDGHAATEIRGRYVGAEPVYTGGKFIEISYGRPIKRGRDLFGSGASYGRRLNAGAPVWRAGADVSTYLMSELPLVINGKTVPAGGHTLFVDLAQGAWTLIVSDWEPQPRYDPADKSRLWGAYRYTADKRHRTRAHDAHHTAVLARSADLGVPGHVGRRRHDSVDVGPRVGNGAIHRRELASRSSTVR